MSLPRKLSVTGAVVELNYLSQNFVLGFLITCKNFNFLWYVGRQDIVKINRHISR